MSDDLPSLPSDPIDRQISLWMVAVLKYVDQPDAIDRAPHFSSVSHRPPRQHARSSLGIFLKPKNWITDRDLYKEPHGSI